MTDHEQFAASVAAEIEAIGENKPLLDLTRDWFLAAGKARYSYHFTALGLPIIQFPQDMVAVQELVWSVKPDLIVETGIARGGSLVWSAGLMAMLDVADAFESGTPFDPKQPKRLVLGLDIDIRTHNREAIERHPMSPYIKMLQGSSIDELIIEQVREIASGYKKVMIFLDSNHTHDHVLAELKAYAPLVTQGSYCVVFDTMIEETPADVFSDRPWGPGNSPKSAVDTYLAEDKNMTTDQSFDSKLLITVAKGGYLRRER